MSQANGGAPQAGLEIPGIGIGGGSSVANLRGGSVAGGPAFSCLPPGASRADRNDNIRRMDEEIRRLLSDITGPIIFRNPPEASQDVALETRTHLSPPSDNAARAAPDDAQEAEHFEDTGGPVSERTGGPLSAAAPDRSSDERGSSSQRPPPRAASRRKGLHHLRLSPEEAEEPPVLCPACTDAIVCACAVVCTCAKHILQCPNYCPKCDGGKRRRHNPMCSRIQH